MGASPALSDHALPLRTPAGEALALSALCLHSVRPSRHEFSSFSKRDRSGKNLPTEDVQRPDGK